MLLRAANPPLARASLPLLALAAAALTSACVPAAPAEAPHMVSWADPEGRFTVELPGQPTPRDVQEITALGTVNYRVHSVNTDTFVYRISAFAYPASIPGVTRLDVPGELEHASGRAVARMRGTVEHAEPVTVDGVRGLDLTFSLTTEDGHRGRGLQRILVSEAPAVRYQALCLGPAEADIAACQAFVRSLHPRAAAPPAPAK